eukprot:5877774-Pleurochrysis_carterae.AAC.2
MSFTSFFANTPGASVDFRGTPCNDTSVTYLLSKPPQWASPHSFLAATCKTVANTPLRYAAF